MQLRETILGYRAARAAALALIALGLFAALVPARAAASLEEKMQYERALEQKVEDVLANLLGPGKSRVMIRASLDFSAKESVQMRSEGGQGPDFAWGDINKASAPSELLPGFVDGSAKNAPLSGNYQREVVYPQAMVKRLTVSLVLSETIPDDQAKAAQKVVQDLLAMDIARGDELLVMRARFAPIWYTSEMLGTLVKYGVIGLIAIVGMGIVSLGFLRMAAALRTMEGEGPGTNIRMEMAAEAGAEAAPPEPGFAAAAALPKPRSEPADSATEQGVIFNVKEEKLEILVRMLAKDSPEDIAVIVAHLPHALRSRFVSMLHPAVAAAVVSSVAKVRFLDADMISQIKDDLERQLDGAVGGYGKAVELIQNSGFRTRKALLAELQRKDPEVAAAVRQQVFLIEDIELLTDDDLSRLVLAVPLETLAAAASELSPAAMARIKSVLPERSWKMLMSYGRSGEEKVAEAVDQVAAATLRLISEGKIARPSPQQGLLPEPKGGRPS